MRRSWGAATIGAAACLIGSLSAAPVFATPTTVVANYQMENDTGTAMADSAGTNDGVIATPHDGLDTNVVTPGGHGYSWGPLPASVTDGRVVTVPDNAAIDPQTSEFAVEVRINTEATDGVIAQKGESGTAGGQWRVQLAGGQAACLFRSDAVRGAAQSTTDVSDGTWHTITCELTGTGTTVYVDTTKERHQNKPVTGGIDNSVPLTVGGKVGCGNVTACDYFVGLVDYIKIFKGGDVNNPAPTAKFTATCGAADPTCDFDATATTDDGSIDSYEWDWTNDGSFDDTTANPLQSHTYVNPGTYTVKLRVTDNDGATDSAVRKIDVFTGTPPTRPTQPAATAGLGSAKVTWKAPHDLRGATVTNYVVTSIPDGKTCHTGDGTTLTCTVTGLTPGKSYTFRVKANSSVGPTANSKETTPVTPWGKPTRPGSVGARAGNHQATVTWTAANGRGKPVRSYVVTRLPGGVKKTVDGSARKTVFKRLKNGTVYHFTVAAVNVAGRGLAATTKSVTPVGPPTRPANVTAKGGNNSAVVKWGGAKPNGSRILHYKIVSSDGQHRVVGAAARQVKMKFLKPGHTYKFRVRAINAVGAGAWSAWTKAVRVH
jgi:PKD repeat protein